jgi:GT2 family glycosyltransferase
LTIEISVIVATSKANDVIAACLSALASQAKQNDAEVIVVESAWKPVPDSVKNTFPEILFVTCADTDSHSEMKAVGIRAAQGEIIALTQAHCIPQDNWLQMHRMAHRRLESSAIGGAVIIHLQATIAERVGFLCEYGKFNIKRSAGPASFLASSNVSYKRRDLLEAMDDDYWETDIQRKLCQSGRGLWYLPDVTVIHHRKCTASRFLLEKFNYSRYFAARRFQHKGRAFLYAIGCVLLPVIVLTRLLITFYENGKLYTEFMICIPYVIAISIAWTAGEFVGYIFGSGNSDKYFG